MRTVELEITSLSSFIDSVNKKSESLKGSDEIFNLWFRGEPVSKISHTPLVPKAYRTFGGPLDENMDVNHVFQQAQIIEGNLKAEFAREATPYLTAKGITRTSWNDYFFMQHYGLKTRLLDWTESALIALFFAVSDRPEEKLDAKIWILNPHRLNKFTTSTLHFEEKGFSIIPSSSLPREAFEKPLFNESEKWNLDELTRRYLELNFEATDTTLNYYPLAIMPPLLDERMANQQSCFTIFGNQVNGLLVTDKKDEFLDSVIIPFHAKNSIKEELRRVGITYKTVYPDLEGLCKSIADKYDSDDLILKRI